MSPTNSFILERDAVMCHYTEFVASYCDPFCCKDNDLDEFFSKDAFHYETELLGKTYAWIDSANPMQILAMVTLANDSVKAKFMAGSARNRLQRSVTNAKRGMNYPAVLIGRLGAGKAASSIHQSHQSHGNLHGKSGVNKFRGSGGNGQRLFHTGIEIRSCRILRTIVRHLSFFI